MTYSEDAGDILRVLAKYARGIDRIDMALVRECYWDDATDNHLVFAGGPDEFVAWAEAELQRYGATGHFMAQSFLEIEADLAVVETPFRAWHAPADTTGSIFILNGRYLDLMERREGKWRILRRDVVADLSESYPYDPAIQLSNGLSKGALNRPDPSYEAFARLRQ